MPIRTTVDKLPVLLVALHALPRTRVLVGVPSDDEQPHLGTNPIDPNARRDTPINNSTLAAIHNFGSPAANIPQREFMAPGIRTGQEQITKYLREAGTLTLDGNANRANQAFHAAGLTAQNHIRRKIMDGPFVPLAPVTIRRRLAKAKHGKALGAADIAAGSVDVRPLVDTASMRNSISYVIRCHSR
jgi:hypothetical protein